MRMAIIGGGISGLTTAHLLCNEHEDGVKSALAVCRHFGRGL